jgi:hypothetical protein
MEGWSLPPFAQSRMQALEAELGEARIQGPDGGLIRGAHWRNFLVKYAESNRMHKTMVALSALCRERGDPPVPRRALGRAQCNDAYWHGVFGGLYLPHLRHAIWRQLAIAERELRHGEALACEARDVDGDGFDEQWIHSAAFSALVSPRRGGAVEVFIRFADEANLADALTRRREAYHEAAVAATGGVLPPADADTRAILVERVVPGGATVDDFARGGVAVHASWSGVPMTAASRVTATEVEIRLHGDGLEKALVFAADGALRVSYRWDPAAFPDGSAFTTELSLMREVPIVATGAELLRYPITTVAKSERGLEETQQGMAVVACWPASAGRAQLEIPA